MSAGKTWYRTYSSNRITRLIVGLITLSIGWYYLSPRLMGGIRMYSPGDSYSGPVWIKDSGQEYIEFDPFELPKLVSGGNASPPGDLKVAVLEHAGFHDEVIGAIVKTLEDIGAKYTVYRDSWRWHFDTVLKTFLPDFAEPLNINEFTTHANQGKIDIVIHTSCDYNWRERLPKSAIEALENNHHMHVICVQHELENLSVRDRDAWKKVVDQKRFSLLTLSTHTSRELSRHVMKWEYETGDSAWRNVNVDTLIPIFPVDPDVLNRHDKSADSSSPKASAGAIPSRLAILGNVTPSRRNFQAVIAHLHAAIKADPAAWGYKLDITSGKYTAAADSERPAVTLHLVGNKPDSVEIQIPAEIDGVVNLHSALEYDEFYTLIATMDLILPAFVNFVYVDHKLSSAIPTGIISRVPILSTPLLLEAYSFLRSPALVLHPSSMSEIEAVRLLRARQDPMAGEDVVLPGYKPYQGSASRFEWDRYHQRLYDANARVMKNLLQHTRLREFVQSGGVRAEDEVTMDKGRSAGA